MQSGQPKESVHCPYPATQMTNWKTLGYFDESESQFCVFIKHKSMFSEDKEEQENWLFLDEID